MLIELSLTVNQQDYNDLVSGNRIAILYRPYPTDRKFILTPLDQGEITTNTLVNVFDRELLKPEQLNETLASLLNTSLDQLKEAFTKINNPVLLYLRAYLFSPAITLKHQTIIGHQALNYSAFIDNLNPIIPDQDFSQKYDSIHKAIKIDPKVITIDKIKRILEEAENRRKHKLVQELVWIKTITTLGDRSIEKDMGKSKFQAGTDFENIVRKALEFLGFTVDYSHKGGAGGLDIFCSQPYPLTGECKAGKTIPSDTPQELIKLGGMKLGMDSFLESSKLIIGAGPATSDAIKASSEWKISIVKAMTLQKLVELSAKYPNSVDLVELKKYFIPGQTDHSIEEYIRKIEDEIKLRSKIIQLVKQYDKQSINFILGVYSALNPLKPLTEREFYNILIELSSPLTGYLGREKCNDNNWKNDRFYFLRDLNYSDHE
jgi:hypothetical protein